MTAASRGRDCPKVSVLMVTYNHEAYVAQALDSILMQEADFDYEIIIGDDCSTDNTREILIGYQAGYPDRIRLLLHERNLGYHGKGNFARVLAASRGHYAHILEGDDYWTQCDKLQRQVDFLDRHSDFVSCFHWSDWLDQESGGMRPGWRIGPPIIKEYYTLDDLLEHGNFMQTASVMFRRNLFGDIPDWYFELFGGDFALHILNAHHGKIGFLDEAMAVYRAHEEGTNTSRGLAKRCRDILQLYGIVGIRLNLRSRESYRIGVSKFHSMLSAASWADGHRAGALAAGVKALGIAPLERKFRIGLRILIAFTPTSYRFPSVLRHFMIIVDEQGLGALLGKAYSKAKRRAFRIRSHV
ncbi:MAG: glycosyltransferase [Thermodesulfobacteriota bacterium]|nr:glycosyltransferase [Thermodesulfobacteriota bacterium]